MRGTFAFRGIMLLGLVLLGALVFVGCSEDSVTPNDEITPDEEDVAHQSGFLAYAIVNVLPEMGGRSAMPEEIWLGDPFSGSFWHDVNPEHIWTEEGSPLSLELEGSGVVIQFEFDITAYGDPLLANGTGKLTLVDFWLNFTVIDVLVPEEGYPLSGRIEVVSPNATGEINFNPDGTATIVVGAFSWSVDLDTGEVTPI